MKLKLILLLSLSFINTLSFGEVHHHRHDQIDINNKFLSPMKTFPFEPGTYKLKGVSRNVIYITIDDGPYAATNDMLDVLYEYGIKASFFLQGQNVKMRRRAAERTFNEGHLIGNHSWKHRFDFATASIFVESLLSTHQQIIPYAPRDLYLFRAPGGVWNNWRTQLANTHPILKKYVGPIFWNVGGGTPRKSYDADWKCWTNGVSASRCARSYIEQIYANYNIGQASIVLMHDLNRKSVSMLRMILETLKSDNINWRFETLDSVPSIQKARTR